MIDRISRSFVNYSAYRNHMTVQPALSNSFETRESHSILQANGRARLTAVYPRRAVKYTLVNAMEESDRIRSNNTYSGMGMGYVPSTVDSQGYPYRGQNIDVKA